LSALDKLLDPSEDRRVGRFRKVLVQECGPLDVVQSGPQIQLVQARFDYAVGVTIRTNFWAYVH
jgi:hypothetical protein